MSRFFACRCRVLLEVGVPLFENFQLLIGHGIVHRVAFAFTENTPILFFFVTPLPVPSPRHAVAFFLGPGCYLAFRI